MHLLIVLFELKHFFSEGAVRHRAAAQGVGESPSLQVLKKVDVALSGVAWSSQQMGWWLC